MSEYDVTQAPVVPEIIVRAPVRKPERSKRPARDPLIQQLRAKGELPVGGDNGPGSTVGHHPAHKLQQLGGGETPSTDGIAEAFERVFGTGALEKLVACFTDKPVVLLAGDQLTGKSTVAKGVAELMDGEAAGSGKIVRAMAAEAGLSIEAFSAKMSSIPDLDEKIDYQACELIGKGGAAAMESRMAGQLGQFLRGLGRQNVFMVYLQCSPKERALRYVNREISPAARRRVESQLTVPENATLEECIKALTELGDPAIEKVAASMGKVAGRDQTDYDRLMELYGVDYRDTRPFDLVVETTGKSPTEVLDEVRKALPAGFANS